MALDLEADLKDVSYHIRQLKALNCVEEVDRRIVRGSVEHFYCATELHMIDTEEWMELVEAEPQMAEALTDEFMQAIVDDYTESRRAEIVGLDEEFWIVRTPLVLDPEGVREALEAAEAYEDAMTNIAARSAARQHKEEAPVVPVSSSIVFFKTPPRNNKS